MINEWGLGTASAVRTGVQGEFWHLKGSFFEVMYQVSISFYFALFIYKKKSGQ